MDKAKFIELLGDTYTDDNEIFNSIANELDEEHKNNETLKLNYDTANTRIQELINSNANLANQIDVQNAIENSKGNDSEEEETDDTTIDSLLEDYLKD